MMTREERKNKAIELMKELDIYEAYIEEFEKENRPIKRQKNEMELF